MDETRKLASFVCETKLTDIPADVVERHKIFVLDNIASGIVGHDQPWTRMVAELVRESSSNGDCTVMGRDWRASRAGAALVNGAAVGGFETDHGSPLASAHPSATVFPAALAVAEAAHLDGASFLAATILGYEVLCRVGQAATRAVEDDRGFHGPGTNGPFGSAAAVGKLLGLDETGLTHALGIAGSHGSGLLEFVWEGAMTKRLHLGRSAQTGLESALLASKGFTGPSTVVEGKFGFLNVYSPAPRPERLLDGLGEVWRGEEELLKPYACHGTHMAVIEALDRFKATNPLPPDEIATVALAAPEFTVYKHTDAEPRTIMAAQYSVVFGVAIALSKDVSDPYVYDEETLWDPAVRDLAKRVEAVVDDRYAASHALDPAGEVTLVLRDGTRHVIPVSGFTGSPKTPFTFEDASRKLRACLRPAFEPLRAETIIKTVRELENLADVADLAALMRP